MPDVRAIGFDLDNTLWDIEPVLQRADQNMREFLAQRYPRMRVDTNPANWRAQLDCIAAAFPHLSHDFTFMRKEVLRQCAVQAGYLAEVAEEAFEVFFSWRNQVVLYDDVLPVLERLRRHYRLFALTNGNADLERVGLAHLFERSFAARDVGALKPDPAIFRALQQYSGLDSGQIVYVGDDPLADIHGARGAGMTGIWINRACKPWPGEFHPPSATIGNLNELTEWLGLQ